MNRASAWLPPAVLLALTVALVTAPDPAQAADIGYVEDFALARDRAAALRQLIPGTEDYYYYHALHLLNTGRFDQLAALTGPWHRRHGQTPRLTEVQVRAALLGYDHDPKATFTFLANHLGLTFDHQRETLDAKPDLPVALDPKLIGRDALKARSFSGWSGLENLEDAALDWAAAENLDGTRRRQLLQRLRRPDLPNLAKLVDADLRTEHAGPFGSMPVHAMLTVPQLEELAKLHPGLVSDGNYVRFYASKLCPGADTDWKRDKAAARAFLTRLQAFADPLPPVHNPLKAHVLFHRLALDRTEGTYDKARFLAYLQLPRFQPYMNPRFNERIESQRFPAHLNADYSAHTLLPAVGADQELVRDYLRHFLVGADTPDEFAPYIEAGWLAQLFAEAKVEAGLGDPEAWASRLPPETFAALRDRVDIDFVPTNKTDFAADEAVKLELDVKNVPTLLVKVFEINTAAFYRAHQREVDTDLNLDGLVPNAEQTHTFTEPPLRRVRRTFELPQLTKPGLYVVDFIGSGKSSRALVRKGRLKPLTATGTAGQTVTVVDEQNRPVPEATVWLAGVEYRCDKDGRAVVPFSAAPGRRPVVLTRGDFACLDTIDHQPEAYRLTAGIHVDRESLLAQKLASVVVRPGLFLNGRPVSVKLLEDVKLHITSVDHGGIVATVEVPDFKLFEDRESVHDFRVPGRLHRLTVTLTARVKSLSLGKPVDLAATESFGLKEIDRTDKIEDLHLAKFGEDFVIELLGRTGEAKPDRPITLALKHRDFKEQVGVTLKTNDAGRVILGSLPDIVTVTATGPEGTAHTWALPTDRHTYRPSLHAKAGETVTVPYLGTAAKPTRAEFALLAVRGGMVVSDRFDALVIGDGLVECRGLTPGDYQLVLKRDGATVHIRVTDGPAVAGHLLGAVRQLEVPDLKPTQIAGITADDRFLTVRLKDPNKFARVHVFATRYVPAFPAFDHLGRVRDADLGWVIPTRPESVYLTGRNIGDEYRYVLDRRGLKKFPGVMVDRPQLLLNPWAVRSTETGEQLAQGGEMFRPKGVPPRSEAGGGSAVNAPPAAAGGDFADLDFLADPAAVVLNLVPDADGVVRVDRKRLGPHAVVRVVAVDPLATTERTVGLPEQPARFVDLRLRDGLDPAGHFTQQKQVTVLAPGGAPFVLADAVGSRFEAYDSLARVYTLFTALSRDPKLAEFAFVLTWPKLKDEEKRSLYSRFACHELHVFLLKKDPAFFNAVVRPYLANKKDKTFLDEWLLGADVSGYLDPWKYARLNAAERALLARRLPGERARAARHLDDLVRLLPPNVARDILLFDSALQAGDLQNTDGSGLTKELRDLKSVKDAEKLSLGFAAGGGVPGGGPASGGLMSGRAGMQPGQSNGPAAGMGAPAATPPPAPSPDPHAPAEEAKKEAKQRDGRLGAKKADEALGDAKPEAAELYFEDDRAKLPAIRQLYRKVDPTMEWAENNYYKLRITEQAAALVPASAFWLDYARHDDTRPFLSQHLAEASRNFTEMMLALAVLDLPFEAPKHQVAFEGGRMTLAPAGPVIAFHEEVKPADAPDAKVPVLVGQNFYRPSDRFREENGERVDKYVTGEFVARVVYGCQVVVTNPTATRQRLTVLVQIPTGAIAVAGGQPTRATPIELEPYRTATVDVLFYFPGAGRFAHFPTHVAKAGKVVAAAAPAQIEVLDKPRTVDTAAWEYVSQFGTAADVLALLARENVAALNLDKVAWRMRDRAFYDAVLPLLRDRHAYSNTLWAYGVYHRDPAVTREFLTHQEGLIAQVGGPLDTPLLAVDPVARHGYEHLEYKPLVNARAHALGSRRQIVNPAVYDQYHRLLKTLTYRGTLDDTDLLAVAYYLLLQDRTEEALAAFARVNPDKVATRLQYDYCAAYLALAGDDPAKARAIAAKHTTHPVDRWRHAFAQLVNVVDEAAGRGPRVADPEDRGQDKLAATEPGFEAAAAGKGVSLTWQNLEAVTVNYYPMDVELLFSRAPFAQAAGGQFAVTKPAATQAYKLPAGKDRVVIPLPDELARRNVLVEVVAAGRARAVPFFATEMDVKVVENFGQVRVSDAVAGKPLSRVYVKVYARLADGSVKFHKDGYTDVRGRFDYASVNTPERQAVQRFGVLVLSDDRGAVIREAAPPQQ